ncbi:hypothetical protein EON63_13650 [archaeon]|nr:MAG: hypothetical protein EON63_13650 [archaeon]
MLPEEQLTYSTSIQHTPNLHTHTALVHTALQRMLGTLSSLEAHLVAQRYYHTLVHETGVAAFVTSMGVVRSVL